MRHLVTPLLILGLLCLIVLTGGCALTAGAPAAGHAALPAALLQRLPPLPERAAPREVTAAHATTVPGRQYAEHSPGTAIEGEEAHLLAAADELQWVYYQLPTNGFPVLGVEASLATVSGSAWAGLSNYMRGTWDFAPAGEAVALPAGADNTSPDGFVYLAVASYDASEVHVLTASIVLDQPGWASHVVATYGHQLAWIKLFADGPGGLPHIAFIDQSIRQVHLERSSTALPAQAADWTDVMVDTTVTETFSQLDAQFINGRPAVAYDISSTDQLIYSYAGSAEPQDLADWSSSVVDDTFVAILPQISLCEMAMMPRLAYTTIPDGLMLAAADTATPDDADWQRSLIGEGLYRPALIDLGLELGLCYLTSLPAVSIGYAYSTTGSPADPADWEFSELLPTAYESLPGATGIAKVRPAGEWLPFCAALPAAGWELHAFQAAALHPLVADWTDTILDAGTGITSVAACTAGGRPAVAYTDGSSDSVLVAWAGVQQPGTVDDWQFSTAGTNNGDRSVSIAEVAETVAVAYFDSASLELRFAYLEQ